MKTRICFKYFLNGCRAKLIVFYTKVWVKQAIFLEENDCSEMTGIFQTFKPECALWKLIRFFLQKTEKLYEKIKLKLLLEYKTEQKI